MDTYNEYLKKNPDAKGNSEEENVKAYEEYLNANNNGAGADDGTGAAGMEGEGTVLKPEGEASGTVVKPSGEASGTVVKPSGKASGTVVKPSGEASGTVAEQGSEAIRTGAEEPSGEAEGTVAEGEGTVLRDGNEDEEPKEGDDEYAQKPRTFRDMINEGLEGIDLVRPSGKASGTVGEPSGKASGTMVKPSGKPSGTVAKTGAQGNTGRSGAGANHGANGVQNAQRKKASSGNMASGTQKAPQKKSSTAAGVVKTEVRDGVKIRYIVVEGKKISNPDDIIAWEKKIYGRSLTEELKSQSKRLDNTMNLGRRGYNNRSDYDTTPFFGIGTNPIGFDDNVRKRGLSAFDTIKKSWLLGHPESWSPELWDAEANVQYLTTLKNLESNQRARKTQRENAKKATDMLSKVFGEDWSEAQSDKLGNQRIKTEMWDPNTGQKFVMDSYGNVYSDAVDENGRTVTADEQYSAVENNRFRNRMAEIQARNMKYDQKGLDERKKKLDEAKKKLRELDNLPYIDKGARQRAVDEAQAAYDDYYEIYSGLELKKLDDLEAEKDKSWNERFAAEQAERDEAMFGSVSDKTKQQADDARRRYDTIKREQERVLNELAVRYPDKFNKTFGEGVLKASQNLNAGIDYAFYGLGEGIYSLADRAGGLVFNGNIHGSFESEEEREKWFDEHRKAHFEWTGNAFNNKKDIGAAKIGGLLGDYGLTTAGLVMMMHPTTANIGRMFVQGDMARMAITGGGSAVYEAYEGGASPENAMMAGINNIILFRSLGKLPYSRYMDNVISGGVGAKVNQAVVNAINDSGTLKQEMGTLLQRLTKRYGAEVLTKDMGFALQQYVANVGKTSMDIATLNALNTLNVRAATGDLDGLPTVKAVLKAAAEGSADGLVMGLWFGAPGLTKATYRALRDRESTLTFGLLGNSSLVRLRGESKKPDYVIAELQDGRTVEIHKSDVLERYQIDRGYFEDVAKASIEGDLEDHRALGAENVNNAPEAAKTRVRYQAAQNRLRDAGLSKEEYRIINTSEDIAQSIMDGAFAEGHVEAVKEYLNSRAEFLSMQSQAQVEAQVAAEGARKVLENFMYKGSHVSMEFAEDRALARGHKESAMVIKARMVDESGRESDVYVVSGDPYNGKVVEVMDPNNEGVVMPVSRRRLVEVSEPINIAEEAARIQREYIEDFNRALEGAPEFIEDGSEVDLVLDGQNVKGTIRKEPREDGLENYYVEIDGMEVPISYEELKHSLEAYRIRQVDNEEFISEVNNRRGWDSEEAEEAEGTVEEPSGEAEGTVAKAGEETPGTVEEAPETATDVLPVEAEAQREAGSEAQVTIGEPEPVEEAVSEEPATPVAEAPKAPESYGAGYRTELTIDGNRIGVEITGEKEVEGTKTYNVTFRNEKGEVETRRLTGGQIDILRTQYETAVKPSGEAEGTVAERGAEAQRTGSEAGGDTHGTEAEKSPEEEAQHSESVEEPRKGVFGTIYTQFRGKAKEAIDWLTKKKGGEAVGALHHHNIGDISLVWGDEKAGLAKIAKKHPEVLDDLQNIIDSMEIVQESDNRIKLESDTHFAVVSKEYKGEPREKWLLTSYEKKETSEPANSRMDVESNREGKSDDTATRQDSDVSAGKSTEISGNDQEKVEENAISRTVDLENGSVQEIYEELRQANNTVMDLEEQVVAARANGESVKELNKQLEEARQYAKKVQDAYDAKYGHAEYDYVEGSEADRNAQREDLGMINGILEKLGSELRFTRNADANGVTIGNDIWVSTLRDDARNPTGHWLFERNPDGTYMRTASGERIPRQMTVAAVTGHEVTHLLGKKSNRTLQNFIRSVEKAMGEDFGKQIERIRGRYQEAYEERGMTLTENQLREEVAADYAGRMMSDPVFAERVAKELNGEKSLYQMFAERINNFLTSVGLKAETKTNMQRCQDIWMQAAKEAHKRQEKEIGDEMKRIEDEMHSAGKTIHVVSSADAEGLRLRKRYNDLQTRLDKLRGTYQRRNKAYEAYGEPMTIEEFVCMNMPRITPESYRKETGAGTAEQKKQVGRIAGPDKGGVSIDVAAEQLTEQARNEFQGFTGDDTDMRDIIIDVLMSSENMAGYLKDSRMAREEQYARMMEQQYDEFFAQANEEEVLREYMRQRVKIERQKIISPKYVGSLDNVHDEIEADILENALRENGANIPTQKEINANIYNTAEYSLKNDVAEAREVKRNARVVRQRRDYTARTIRRMRRNGIPVKHAGEEEVTRILEGLGLTEAGASRAYNGEEAAVDRYDNSTTDNRFDGVHVSVGKNGMSYANMGSGDAENVYSVRTPDGEYLKADDVYTSKEAEEIIRRVIAPEGKASGTVAGVDEILSGTDIYDEIAARMGGRKNASEAMRKAGYAGVDCGNGKLVVFDGKILEQTGAVEMLRDTKGRLYGWADGEGIHLTEHGFNPDTPVHEYGHLYMKMWEQTDPKSYAKAVAALKSSPVWEEVVSDENYAGIKGNDSRVASEVAARLAGRESEGRATEGMTARVKRAVNEFWTWVQRHIFGSRKKLTAGEIAGSIVNDMGRYSRPKALSYGEAEAMFLGENGARRLDENSVENSGANLGALEERGAEAQRTGAEPSGEAEGTVVKPSGEAEGAVADERVTRLVDLSVAKEEEANGVSAEDIKMATGWERGADGLWRYESADFGLKPVDKWSDKEGATLKDVLEDGAEILRAYPELEDINVTTHTHEGTSSYDGNTNTIDISLRDISETRRQIAQKAEDINRWQNASRQMINEANAKGLSEQDIINEERSKMANLRNQLQRQKDDLNRVVLHEVQHAVQRIEGFGRGGNTVMFENAQAAEDINAGEAIRAMEGLGYDSSFKASGETLGRSRGNGGEDYINPKLYAFAESLEGDARTRAISILDGLVEDTKSAWEKVGGEDAREVYKYMGAERAYEFLGGEVEAKNVDYRNRTMTPSERRAKLASMTEDVAREDQIILRGGAAKEWNAPARPERMAGESAMEYAERLGEWEINNRQAMETARMDDVQMSLRDDAHGKLFEMRMNEVNGGRPKTYLNERNVGEFLYGLHAFDVVRDMRDVMRFGKGSEIDTENGPVVDAEKVRRAYYEGSNGIIGWKDLADIHRGNLELAKKYSTPAAAREIQRQIDEIDLADKFYIEQMNGRAMFAGGDNGMPLGYTMPMYSLKDGNTLIGVHNLSEDNLRRAIRKGGFANPSVAVYDVTKGNHEGFGDISLIMPNEKIDSRTGENMGTWTDDVWTPTYPNVYTEFTPEGGRNFHEAVNSVKAADESFKRWFIGSVVSDMHSGYTPDLRWMYLAEKKGIDATQYKHNGDRRWMDIMFNHKTYRSLRTAMSKDEKLASKVEDYTKTYLRSRIEDENPSLRRRDGEEITAFIIRALPDLKEAMKKYLNADGHLEDKYMEEAFKEQKKAYKETDGVDNIDTRNMATRVVMDRGLEEDYAKWAESKLEEFGVEENFRDGYTSSGRLRTVPNTIQNASRLMNKQKKTGNKNFGGWGTFITQFSDHMGSLDAIRKKRGRMQREDVNRDEITQKFSDLAIMLNEKSSDLDLWDGSAARTLAQICKAKDVEAFANGRLKLGLNKEEIGELEDFAAAMKKGVAHYFETKFDRPVMLGEFAAAVVPKGTSADLVEQLKAAGLDVRKYDPKKEGDRARVMQKAANREDVMFSLKEDGANLGSSDEANAQEAENVQFSLVEDPREIERLDNEKTVKVYRAMQLIDGKLYPPMAAMTDGKYVQPIELGQWEKSDERPDLILGNGKFRLNKGNGKYVDAAYNPYFHTSTTPLNDQFSEAQNRPNLVTVEVEVPESELTSGYKAEGAKDGVGRLQWKAGVIQGQLSGTREVILSRWDKPVRIVPDAEVAGVIKEMFGERDITMPSNVVTPSLRGELEKLGVKFVETNNQGKLADGRYYSKVYGTKTDYKPIGENRFGKIYKWVTGKAKSAFEFLVQNRGGYLKSVYHRDDIGDIDLLWGESHNIHNGYGLKHIIEKHIDYYGDFASIEEAERVISDVINNGKSYRDNKDAKLINIEKGDYRVIIAKNAEGNWVLTAFDMKTSKKDKLNKKNAAAIETPSQPENSEEAGAVTSNSSQRKSTELSGNGQENTQFSLKERPIFVSNAEKAVMDVRQEKATAEQWKAMLKKNGGLKAEEDKWIGLSEWLDEREEAGRATSGNKNGLSISKEEVLDFVRSNQLKVEDVEYGETGLADVDALWEGKVPEVEEALRKINERFQELKEEYFKSENVPDVLDEEAAADYAKEELFGGDTESIDGFYLDITPDGISIPYGAMDAEGVYRALGLEVPEGNRISAIRGAYTTKGLTNKKEIALTVPSIEPYNTGDAVHFGDAGDGRAVAWLRFGDAYTPDGKRVMVIDEVQSKRHQDGRAAGYYDKDFQTREKEFKDARDARLSFIAEMKEKYGSSMFGDFHGIETRKMTEQEMSTMQEIEERYRTAHNNFPKAYESYQLPPDAPFRKNWHELAMKRALRYAAENGYDKVVWTTGGQQAERYNIGKVVDSIEHPEEDRFVVYGKDETGNNIIVDENGIVTGAWMDELKGKRLSEVVGKEMAEKMMAMEIGSEISGEDLRIGGEGMSGFYDRMLPQWMDKYGKKWGVKTEDVELELPDAGDRVMHGVDVTDAMKESVLKGQAMFSLKEEPRPVRQEGEGAMEYAERLSTWEVNKNALKEWRQYEHDIDVMFNLPDDDPEPMRPAMPRDGDFTNPEYSRLYNEYVQAHRAWEERERSREDRFDNSAAAQANAILSGDISEVEPRTLEDLIGEDIRTGLTARGINVTPDGIKRAIKYSIMDRRRYIEDWNWQDAIKADDVRRLVPNQKERARIPFIIEGTDRTMLNDAEFEEALKSFEYDEGKSLLVPGQITRLRILRDLMTSGATSTERMYDLIYEMTTGTNFANVVEADEVNSQILEYINGGEAPKDKHYNLVGQEYKRLFEFLHEMAAGNKAARLDMAAYLERRLKNASNMSGTLPDGTKAQDRLKEIIYGRENEQSPELRQAVKMVRDYFESVRARMENAGLFGEREASGDRTTGEDIEEAAMREADTDYVTHIWDMKHSSKEAIDEFNKRLEHVRREYRTATNSPYTRQRVIPTYQLGIEIGLKPKYTDICDIMMDYGHHANEGIANRAFLDDMSVINVVDGKGTAFEKSLPILSKADERGSEYTTIANNALAGYKVLKSAEPFFNIVFGNAYKYGEGTVGRTIGNTYDITSGTMKKINLGMSFFHHGALTETAVGSLGVRVVPVLLNNMMWDTMKSYQSGNGFTMPALLDREATTDAVHHFVALGATQDYVAKDVRNLTKQMATWLDKYKLGRWSGAAFVAEVVDFANREMDTILWDYIHDGFKIYTFKKFAKEIRQKCAKNGVSENTMNKMLDEAGQLVNDLYGGQHWDLLMKSPRTVKIMQRLLLSPDWTWSSLRQAMAPLGVGQLYDDKKFWQKWNMKVRAKDMTDEELIASVRKKNGRAFWFNAMMFFGICMNGLNYITRKNDVDDEDEKAKKERETDPNYQNPYELAYPEGMDFWDYTMFGNTMGKGTLLFAGRYDDGRERYIRWGKQFRELPELFIGDDGFSFPGPMLRKFAGKANPLLQTLAPIIGEGMMLSGWQNPYMKDKKGWDMELGRLKTLLAGFTPFTLQSFMSGDKEWHASDLLMPSTPGFSNYKAQKYFVDAIEAHDMDMCAGVYAACVLNGLDAEKLYKAAESKVDAEQKEISMKGVKDVVDAEMQYQEEKDPKRKAQLQNYLKKQYTAGYRKQIEQQDMLDRFKSYLDGTDGGEEKNQYYLMESTVEDLRGDVQMTARKSRLKKINDEWQKMVKNGDSNADKYYDEHAKDIDEYKTINKVSSVISNIKSHMNGTGDDSEAINSIRELRKSVGIDY